MSGFFASRWIDAPEHVTELAGGLPGGFRAAGVACGIKPSGAPRRRPDRLRRRPRRPAPPASPARARSPRRCCCRRERCRLDAIRAVVVNSGNANAATGRRGSRTPPRCRRPRPPPRLGQPRTRSRSPRPGVIGVPLPMDAVTRRDRRRRARELRADGEADFAEAIRTTDAFPKRACLEVDAGRRDRAADRPGQGRGDDLARLRDAARASSRPTPRCRPRRATCCSA